MTETSRMSETEAARLYGHGRLVWTQASALLEGCQCTWTDLDGIHVADAPPDVLPVGATHLWGWAVDRCVRVRFDGEAAYVAVLRTSEADGGARGDSEQEARPDGSSGPGIAEVVMPVVRRPVTWSPDYRQAGPLPEAVLRRRWELLEVPGAAPVTFVRA
ncbi:hypothetical protein ABT009_30255 [Streptomyces sp. NPDC002896]|uniref:hypothetical protein n=1 Tax=Streptomyces sp. NPDC002896 TaxID=3154438 RepID=UPI00331DB27E